MQTIPEQSLIVVADGGKARLFRSTGHGHELRLTEGEHFTHKNIVNDGPSGARPAEQSPHQTDEATFVKQLVKRLDGMFTHNEFAHLVVIAGPQTLGQMRDAMSKGMAESVAFSLSKDLTNHSAKDIEHALA